MATSLAVPVAYITVMVTALAIFSRVYRRRKIAEVKSWEPWFPTHPARDIYISLLSASASSTASSGNEKDKANTEPPKVPISMLKSALLVRATADVKRIWRIREDKMALTSLHNRGLVGDDTMARFAAAEKELEAEIVDVVQEANTFKQGWGGLIFQTATEMAQAERTREVVLNIPKVRALEEKNMARRKKYLPEASTSATPSKPSPSKIENTDPPAEPAASTPGAENETSAKSTTAVETAASPSGSTTNTPAKNTKSGASSGTSTPSKNTPSKKKKGKKG